MEPANKNPGDVTALLSDLQAGRTAAGAQLFDVVQGELRRLAGAQMAGERSGHTLQPTALVNEAYLRLVGAADTGWENRGHFMRAAARAMRQILVDHARRRDAAKRGGGASRVTLRETSHGVLEPDVEVIAVHEALERLEGIDADAARVVELRYFAGLTKAEAAGVLGITERTVHNTWTRARAWLFHELAS